MLLWNIPTNKKGESLPEKEKETILQELKKLLRFKLPNITNNENQAIVIKDLIVNNERTQYLEIQESSNLTEKETITVSSFLSGYLTKRDWDDQRHIFEVEITGCSQEKADEIIQERLGSHTDPERSYQINWSSQSDW